MSDYDYVIVGGGSAGCVLARRLSEAGQGTVCLVEAGPRDNSWTVLMPAAVSINIKRARFNWQYETAPQSELLCRKMYQPRGKVLGGSSALNGMIFIRGHALDFDRWASEGATGWSYREVLPYFKKLERFSGGADAYRGDAGPLYVDRGKTTNVLHAAFIEAGQQAGYPLTSDVNGRNQYGVGFFDKNIAHGERRSSAQAYLHEATQDQIENLTILTDALVNRVVFERGRAVAVEVIRDGMVSQIRARREVILSAGAIGSPAILMRSGIGPKNDLEKLEIPVVADRAGVGQNLQDHTEVHIQYQCTKPITLYGDLQPARRILAGLQWFATRSGKAATNHYDSGAFLKTDPSVAHPDIQLHFVPIIYNNSVERRVTSHGFRVHAGTLRSKSRGSVSLLSRDPLAKPIIQPNYMTAESDWHEFRAVVDISRDIFSQRAFSKFRGAELSPGADLKSRSEIDQFLREWVDTGYHPCGTCRMGADEAAVVTPDGKVQGVEGLRVCDASIMPSIISGNLNAATIMIAEKISDHILNRRLAPVDVPVGEAGSI